MSDLLDKQMNAQKRVCPTSPKKCAMEMKETNKEKTTHTKYN